MRTVTALASLMMLACGPFGASVSAARLRPQQPARTTQTITQAQADLYERWRANINTNQQVAFEAGKEYLAKYPGDEYAAHVRRWVEAYERAARKLDFQRLFKQQRFAEAYRVGRAILADEPNNLKAMVGLAYAGYLAAGRGDGSFTADSLDYARHAVALLESGAKPSDWQPFVDQADALGYLYFVIGELTFKDDPEESARLFRRALGQETTLRQAPLVYSRLAAAYVAGRYEPLSKEFATRYSGQEETEESRAALARINEVVDRIIDAYARAVALSGVKPQYAEAKRRWAEELTRFYKFRHSDSTEGLDALIASVTSKPLPN